MTYPPQPPYSHQPPLPPKKPSFWRGKGGAAVLLAGGLLAALILTANSGSNKPAPTPTSPAGGAGTGSGTAPPGGLTQETWTQQGNRWVAPSDTAQPAAPAGSFADGTYEVNVDIQSGKYKTAGGDGCYWERQKNDDHNFGSIIANSYSKGPMTVTIKSSDAYFQTSGCTWTKAG